MKIYIHTNEKQFLGAKLAKFSIERFLTPNDDVTVDYINVDKLDIFKDFVGKKYLRKGNEITYEKDDLQSFTLSRFMPPELSNYSGKAMVIDPDIFTVKPTEELLNLDLQGKAIACCPKHSAHDTSMMIMDCEKLKHWDMKKILSNLENKSLDYKDLITLRIENQESILDLPRKWNNLDELNNDTNMIHMTGRLTQPWKTGLKIDFKYEKMKPYFGFIPREPIVKLRGKLDTHYKEHPDKEIIKFFFDLASEAYKAGAVTDEDIDKAIETKDIRPDFREQLSL